MTSRSTETSLFRSVFLELVAPSSSDVITILINIGCELAGYYLAALLIDHKMYGRKTMQAVGFIMSFVLFIIAAEVYPAPVRATAHGFSAAVGKLGALAATVLYNYIDARTKFWVVSWFGLIELCLTLVFIPDTTGLDLREQERYWHFVHEGREHEYHGIAIHPRHISLYERWVLKRGQQYDAELDRKAKVDELRSLYEKVSLGKGEGCLDENEEGVSNNVSSFEWEKNKVQ